MLKGGVNVTQDEKNTKARILQAALDLLSQGVNADRITTRLIAEKAGVNSALVNYHYQTKENLLGQAVAGMMEGIISRVMREASAGVSAQEGLRRILLSTAEAAFASYNACRIAISIELKNGCVNSCAMVMPLLKSIFDDKDDDQLKIVALQLMLPFHHIVIEPQLYGRYLGADFFDSNQRDAKINEMIDCILSAAE